MFCLLPASKISFLIVTTWLPSRYLKFFSSSISLLVLIFILVRIGGISTSLHLYAHTYMQYTYTHINSIYTHIYIYRFAHTWQEFQWPWHNKGYFMCTPGLIWATKVSRESICLWPYHFNWVSQQLDNKGREHRKNSHRFF